MSSNTIITLPKRIDTDSGVCIIYKIPASNDINKEILYHQGSLKIIDHA